MIRISGKDVSAAHYHRTQERRRARVRDLLTDALAVARAGATDAEESPGVEGDSGVDWNAL